MHSGKNLHAAIIRPIQLEKLIACKYTTNSGICNISLVTYSILEYFSHKSESVIKPEDESNEEILKLLYVEKLE